MFRQRAIFCGFIFLPLFLCFLMPLLLLKWPAQLFYHVTPTYRIDFHQGLYAFSVAALWFLIAVSVFLFLPVRKKRSFYPVWSDKMTVTLALILSVLGNVAIITYYTMTRTSPYLQVFSIFSMMPILSVALFLFVLQDYRNFSVTKRLGICVLIIVNLMMTMALPIISGWSGKVIAAFLGLLYVFVLMRYSWRLKVLIFLLIIILSITAILLKDYVRYAFSAHAQPESTETVSVVNTDKLLDGMATSGSIRKIYFIAKVDASTFASLHHKVEYRFPDLKILSPLKYLYLKLMFRMNRLVQFSYVLGSVPSRKPFFHGKTYLPISLIFVPRFMWRDKPSVALGNDFAHEFGFYPKQNKVASVAMPYPLEAWLNFGWWGIFLTPVLIGLIFRVLWNIFCSDSVSPKSLLFGVLMVACSMHGESSAYILIGNLIQSLIVYAVLIYCLVWLISGVGRCFAKKISA